MVLFQFYYSFDLNISIIRFYYSFDLNIIIIRFYYSFDFTLSLGLGVGLEISSGFGDDELFVFPPDSSLTQTVFSSLQDWDSGEGCSF